MRILCAVSFTFIYKEKARVMKINFRLCNLLDRWDLQYFLCFSIDFDFPEYNLYWTWLWEQSLGYWYIGYLYRFVMVMIISKELQLTFFFFDRSDRLTNTWRQFQYDESDQEPKQKQEHATDTHKKEIKWISTPVQIKQTIEYIIYITLTLVLVVVFCCE
jgi:hypothetical protein